MVPAHLLDADQLAHEAVDACAQDGRLEAALGPGYVRPDRKADRAAIARRVFSDPAALRALERLTHPGLQALISERIQDHLGGTGPALLVLDVPLLIEVGLDRRCDALWFVDVPEERRMERAQKNGFSPEEVRRREVHQAPLDRKRARADFVLRNDQSDSALDARIREGLEALGLKVH
jgi:dephospho-CoA kinase